MCVSLSLLFFFHFYLMYSAPRTTVSTRNSRCVSCCSFAREGTNNSVKLFLRRTERVSRNCTCIIFFVLHRSLFVCLFVSFLDFFFQLHSRSSQSPLTSPCFFFLRSLICACLFAFPWRNPRFHILTVPRVAGGTSRSSILGPCLSIYI